MATTPMCISIDSLTSSRCRWPIGEPRSGLCYCGERVEKAGRVYCDKHHRQGTDRKRPDRLYAPYEARVMTQETPRPPDGGE